MKVTLDTNTLPLERALQALGRVSADVKITTVTAREVHGTKWEPKLSLLRVVPEVWVMGQSQRGIGAMGSQVDVDLLERTLAAITNGSFPKPGSRENLTPSQTRQMRDAQIFCTHVREGRDIFVTDDVKAFGSEGSEQRQRIEALAATRVMTLDEFERFCKGV